MCRLCSNYFVKQTRVRIETEALVTKHVLDNFTSKSASAMIDANVANDKSSFLIFRTTTVAATLTHSNYRV